MSRAATAATPVARAVAQAARAAAVTVAETVTELEHRLTTLDSGVRVVTERMPAVRSVALGFWIAAGSADESEQQRGITHLLEHMLFRGSDRYELAGDRPDLRRDGRGGQRGDRQGGHVGLHARA